MNFVTIDFSLNSPGICIFSDNKYNFIGYLKPNTGTKAEQKIQEELNQLVVDKEQDPNERMDLDREYNEMEFEREMEAFWSGIFD